MSEQRLKGRAVLGRNPSKPSPRRSSVSVINRSIQSKVRGFSDSDLEALEDELDFYAFTGIRGPRVQYLMKAA